MSGPLVLSIESSCDETGIALIEDGSVILANVVASQVALHAPSGGIVPEVAARAHLRWIVPVLDDAWADAGVGWDDIGAVAVTYGPGLAGSLLVGINFAKALAWVHERPLIGVNHLEGHVYAAWLRDPGIVETPEPEFPLVALVVSGGHTFLAEMRDHLTYRLLGHDRRRRGRRGLRQGRPAARPWLPGRTGDGPRRRGRDTPRPRLPAGLAGRHVRSQLLGAQDSGAPDRDRGPRRRRPRRRRRTRPCPTRSRPSSRGASRTPWSMS